MSDVGDSANSVKGTHSPSRFIHLRGNKKGVPLLSLPNAEGSLSSSGLGAAVKRAIGIMDSTISSKPAKLARYDDERLDNDDQSLKDFCLEMQGYHVTDHSASVSTYNTCNVIPLDKLKLNERHTPLDVDAFLSRVETYDLRLWSKKPDPLCAFQCARYGWRIAGKNTLVCVSCRSLLSVPNDNGCIKLSEWVASIDKQIQKTGHMTDCIWVKSPSPIHILQLPEGNDMQIYMKHAGESFQRMKTVPIFTTRYRLIMSMFDMNGLKNKTNLKLPQILKGATTGMIEDTALFLMLNGWTMDKYVDAIKCDLCLRQVPLWLCLATPSRSSIEDIVSPKSSPCSRAQSNMKELDPVLSHWFWCPWRKILQPADPEKKMQKFLSNEETNLFSENHDGIADEAFHADMDVYMKLASKIDTDFKRGRLLFGSNLEMSNNSVAITTIGNFKEILDSAVRSSSGSKKQLGKSEPTPETNDIISIKQSIVRIQRSIFPSAGRKDGNISTDQQTATAPHDLNNLNGCKTGDSTSVDLIESQPSNLLPDTAPEGVAGMTEPLLINKESIPEVELEDLMRTTSTEEVTADDAPKDIQTPTGFQDVVYDNPNNSSEQITETVGNIDELETAKGEILETLTSGDHLDFGEPNVTNLKEKEFELNAEIDNQANSATFEDEETGMDEIKITLDLGGNEREAEVEQRNIQQETSQIRSNTSASPIVEDPPETLSNLGSQEEGQGVLQAPQEFVPSGRTDDIGQEAGGSIYTEDNNEEVEEETNGTEEGSRDHRDGEGDGESTKEDEAADDTYDENADQSRGAKAGDENSEVADEENVEEFDDQEDNKHYVIDDDVSDEEYDEEDDSDDYVGDETHEGVEDEQNEEVSYDYGEDGNEEEGSDDDMYEEESENDVENEDTANGKDYQMEDDYEDEPEPEPADDGSDSDSDIVCLD